MSALVCERPDNYNSSDFLEWVNAVASLRHGNIRKLDKILVLEEAWTTDELRKVKKMNNNLDPRRFDLPVIVLRGLKLDYLLDGNRRINTWVANKSDELHPVWLVHPLYEKGKQ